MKVFHGSTSIVQNPQVSFAKKYLDFGRGFYLTTYQKQAERWAQRKALRKNTAAFVSVYELTDDLTQAKILRFDQDDDAWIDFVCACRRGETIYQKYDVIIGHVANDDVFKTVDMYFQGIWDKQKALQELRYYQKNDQMCIVKQSLIHEHLTFLNAYEVK